MTSAASATVLVQAVPKQLPAPVFQSNLYTTSRGALMTHLVPGSLITVFQGGAIVGQATCDNDAVVVAFSSPPVALAAGSKLAAQAQRSGQSSEFVSSQALVDPPVVAPRTVRAPGLGDALACAKSISAGDSFPGATVTLLRGGKPFNYLMPAGASNLVVDQLQVGDVVSATQGFEVQEWNSSASVSRAAEATNPPVPAVTGDICPLRDSDLLVSGIGGALVHLRVVGSVQHLLSGVIDPSSGQCRFRVPAALVPQGVKTLEIIQALCARESPPASVTVLSAPTPAPGEPQFRTSLFSCGRVIALAGLVENTMITVVSASVGVIGSKLVTKTEEEISVSPLLIAGDVISVIGQACAGAFGGTNKVSVMQRPSPQIKLSQDTLWVGDTEIAVAGITPGSRIDLFIDGIPTASANVATEQHSFQVAALSLGQTVKVQESDCRGPSDQVARSGPVQAKTQLALTVDTVDPHRSYFATVGVGTMVLATVKDLGTQQLISIQVQIDGMAGTIPSNTPVLITFTFDGNATFRTLQTSGIIGATGSLPVKSPLQIGSGQIPPINSDHSNLVTVQNNSLQLKFSDDGQSHPLPANLSGALSGVHRRKAGQGTTASLTGTVAYTLGTAVGVLNSSDVGGTPRALQQNYTRLTVWINLDNGSLDTTFAV